MDWLDLLVVQETLKSPLRHHSSNTSILWHSAFFIVQLSHPYMTTGKTIALTRRTFVEKVTFLLLNMLSRLVIRFLPRSKCLYFMAAVTICSDFGALKNKVCHFTGWAGANCKTRYLPPWRHQDGSRGHRVPASPEQCGHLATPGPFSRGLWQVGPLDVWARAVRSAAGLPHSPSGHWAHGLRAHVTVGPRVLPVLVLAWSPGVGGTASRGRCWDQRLRPQPGAPRACRGRSQVRPGLFCGEKASWQRAGQGMCPGSHSC